MRQLSFVAAALLAIYLVAAHHAVAQVELGANAMLYTPPDVLVPHFEQDTDGAFVPIPGADSVSASLGPGGSPSGSFSYAHVNATTSASSIQGSGRANGATDFPDYLVAEAAGGMHVGFSVDDYTQVILCYELDLPAHHSPQGSPSYFERRTSINLSEFVGPHFSTVFEDFLSGEGIVWGDRNKTATQTIGLGQGNYLVEALAYIWTSHEDDTVHVTHPVPPAEISWELEIKFRDGQDQDTPLLPFGIAPNGGWLFTGVPGHRWFDPVMAHGFEFEMLSEGSFFTEAGMPVGLGDPGHEYLLTYLDGSDPVSVHVAEGTSHFFPAGVTSFTVLNIDPPFDPDDPLAFPIFLDFSTPTADFTMTPILIPEPASFVLLALGGLLLAHRRRRRPHSFTVVVYQNSSPKKWGVRSCIAHTG